MGVLSGVPVLVLVGLTLQPATAPDAQSLRTASREAQEALNAGRFEEAARLYQELVKHLPGVPGLYMNLGMALYLGGKPAQAETHLERAVAEDPALVAGWLFLGASRLEIGKPAAAIGPLEEYLRRRPDEPRTIELLGDAFLQADRPFQAFDTFTRLVAVQPESPRGWYGLGKSCEELAARAFGLVEKQAPESGYWFSLIAASRLAQKQYSSAFYFYRKATEAQPGLRGIHAALAHIYRESGHPDWALQEEAREGALGEPDCTREPQVCRFLSGRYREILDSTRDARDPESLYWQAQACNQLALAAFSRLAQLPPSFELHEVRATIHRNQNRHWEAVKEWRAALELDPGNRAAKEELALSLYLNRDYPAARSLAEELLKTEPDSGRLNFLAGDSLLYQQQVEAAIPYLLKAVKSAPDLLGAHSALGRAYMTLGEAAKAIPHLKRALQTDEDGSLHYQLARAYQRTGQMDAARETMAKYQEIRQQLEAEERRLDAEVVITPP
ncbi:MAG: hypothetical protein Kow001_01230 [Acidobacteriota bacterium]